MAGTFVVVARMAGGLVVACLGAGSALAAAYSPCAAERPAPMAVTDPELCLRLDPVVRKPSALPLDQYEQALQQYSTHFCYRNPSAGWVHDKYVRATGPRVARFADGKWTVSNFGTHSPVMIWYSPEMVAWMKVNRPAGRPAPADPPPPPDGAIMVKELYPNPASACRDVDPLKLLPPYATTMVRDSAGSHDGWFWADHDIGAARLEAGLAGAREIRPSPGWVSGSTASTAMDRRRAIRPSPPAKTWRANPASP